MSQWHHDWASFVLINMETHWRGLLAVSTLPFSLWWPCGYRSASSRFPFFPQLWERGAKALNLSIWKQNCSVQVAIKKKMERDKVRVDEIRTLDNSSSDVGDTSDIDEGSGSGGGDGSTSVGRSGGNGSSADDQENLYFAKKENRRVRNLKFLVIVSLFLVTTAVCLAVYFVTASGQQSEFEAT